jgi:hypothetical protein
VFAGLIFSDRLFTPPLGDFELVSKPNSSKRTQTLEEKMSKTEGQGITSPPPLSDDENASIAETSATPIVEELMKQIERLNAELTKLKTKKGKKNVFASEDDNSSSEEEEEEDSPKCDDEDMAPYMKKFKKYIKKKKFQKGDKKLKTTTKRTCYICCKHGHFIANCPFERRDDSDDKKNYKPYKKDKVYKRSDKPYKKKSYGEAHIGQEWESKDERSNSDSDGVATMAVKRRSSSRKSLFPKLNQGKHTCLMAKENKRKVKTKGISSPKYISSDDSDDDDDAAFPNGLNEKRVIKKLGKELVAQDQLLEDQDDLLEQERKNTCELKRLLKLDKDKNEERAQELAKGKETISSIDGSIGAL